MNQSQIDKMQKELEEQTALLRSMRNSMRMGTYISLLRVFIILVPLVLAFIYLPTLFKQYSESFTDTLLRSGDIALPEGFDFSQIQELLK